MKNIFLLLFLTVSAEAQILPLPPQNAAAPVGSRLCAALVSLSRSAREDTLLNQISSGNIPDFLRRMVPVTTTKTISGTTYTLQYFVTPDYLAVGHDSDYVFMPMTPLLAQKIADGTNCILPTATMVDQIYAAANVKLRPQPIPPDADMDKVPRFIQHNDSVKTLRVPLLSEFPLGSLVGGTKKDVVIDIKVCSRLKAAVPKPVVIYGWHQINGVPIQPTYNGHGETYADYSHGIRLVQRTGKINGADISLTDILQDSAFHSLISDTVLVKPFYDSSAAIK